MGWKDFYRERGVIPPQDTPLHDTLCNYVIGLEPASVFEFGCASGINLKRIIEALDIPVAGMDINKKCVKAAVVSGIKTGDEVSLSKIRNRSGLAMLISKPKKKYDLAITCSVLCHMEDPRGALEDLQRIANQVLICETSETPKANFFAHNYPGQVLFEHQSAMGALYKGYLI